MTFIDFIIIIFIVSNIGLHIDQGDRNSLLLIYGTSIFTIIGYIIWHWIKQ